MSVTGSGSNRINELLNLKGIEPEKKEINSKKLWTTY